MHWFVTGTDSDVGKTHVVSLLLKALNQAGRPAVGFKPFACGSREDAKALLAAGAPGMTMDKVNPVYLKTPASPYTGALIENRKLDLDALHADFRELAGEYRHVLVEGVGGWEVPLAPRVTVADFARRLGLPVLIVVNSKLGALNHTILTARSIHSRGLTCAGIILNHVADERHPASITHRMILEESLNIPVIGEVMHGETDGSALVESLLESE
ncbi:dethiobiotin synthase [Phragmitibacter flavus]|uniref:ATP-dependent dethiobiotin synthetase BioD n=1 Tax=Phragmitibacter flavus TaxID=2576071 RepID=A0A5R8KFT0_9BACT|nr:dethiobiotin synthase [Phragmitibacter flavus]TLD71146.1 dethiobiotin synthase [Phragmitibacter flavus]